jgi:hypothetical protein
MHYVCLENNAVISILNYEPQAPSSVSVVAISDQDYAKIELQTHRFDIVTKTVVPIDPSILANKTVEQSNAIEREFLNSTDWQVLRHIRQKALGIPTSLTDVEYLTLEQNRNDAASRIV